MTINREDAVREILRTVDKAVVFPEDQPGLEVIEELIEERNAYRDILDEIRDEASYGAEHMDLDLIEELADDVLLEWEE